MSQYLKYRIAAATISAALLNTALAEGDELLKHVPASSEAILFVNLHKLANDPLTSKVLGMDELREANEKIRQVSAATNIDLQRDLEQLVFSKGTSGTHNDAVLLVKGNFDPARIRPLISLAAGNTETTTVGTLNDVLAWKNNDYQTNYLAFLPGNIAALTFSREALESAMGESTATMQKVSPALTLISPRFQEALAWLHVGDPAGVTGDSGMKTLPIKSGDAVVDNTENLYTATIHANIESTERAKDLYDMANGLLALAKLQNNTIAQSVRLGTDATSKTLIAKMRYSRPEVLAMVDLVNAQKRRDFRRPDRSTTFSAELDAYAARRIEEARRQAQQIRKNADMARKRAELMRERARIDRELIKLERESRDNATSMSASTPFRINLGDPPVPPQPPRVPAPPSPPNVDAFRSDLLNKTLQERARLGGETNDEIQELIQKTVQEAVQSVKPELQKEQ